jgi:hypothetical protein
VNAPGCSAEKNPADALEQAIKADLKATGINDPPTLVKVGNVTANYLSIFVCLAGATEQAVAR